MSAFQGDEYVDWVGMSLYHWGNTYPYVNNVLPDARKFTSTVGTLYTTSSFRDSRSERGLSTAQTIDHHHNTAYIVPA